MRAFPIRPIALPLLLATVLLPACRLEVGSSFSGITMIPARTGPEFPAAFPTPGELLRTADIAATRKILDTIPLPETEAHHRALVEALAEVDSVDSRHLELLTEAVAIPPRTANHDTGKGFSIAKVNGRLFIDNKGEGKFAPVIDELVLAGAEKLSDVGPESFGRLATLVQTPKALVELGDVLLARSDDGTAAALRTILDNIPFAGRRQELCTEVLLPRDRLSGDRMEVAIRSMSFDSNRTLLIRAIYKTLDGLEPETLVRHVKLQSFDSGRTEVVALGVPLLRSLDARHGLELVKTASFDSGRTGILALTQDKLRLDKATEALEFVRVNSFDSGRTKTLKTLLAGRFPPVTAEDLIAFTRTASFDSDRQEMLQLLQPHFDGDFTRDTARRLIGLFSFDSGKLQFLKLFQDTLLKLPSQARMDLVEALSFASDQKQAMRLIMR